MDDIKRRSKLGVRHLQAVLLFFALVLAYGMRVNMSMAIVAMTDSDNEAFSPSFIIVLNVFEKFVPQLTYLEEAHETILKSIIANANPTVGITVGAECYLLGFRETVEPKARIVNYFDWSIQTQSVILSSFFWGYIVLQIPGGELAARFGGALLITICIALNAAISMVIPASAYYGGWKLVCACRVLQGLTQGFIVPSVHNLIGKWAPVEEKSRLGAMVHAGSQLGNAIQLMASGFIAGYWGWPAIFYVNGALGAVWTVIYLFLGSSSPQSSKMISKEERLYIQSSLGQIGEQKKLRTPWREIWSSVPFLSLILVHCCQNWGFWTLMTEMPSYMKQVLGVDIKANGVMSALPYLAMYLLSFPFGFLSDYLPNRKWLGITATRKLSNSIGLFGPAIALIGLSYAPAGDVTTAVILLTVVVGLNVGHITGLMLVHLDMSPNFAGTLLGITNCAANIISIIAPLVAGAVLKDETNPDDWRKVFYIASAVYIAGNTLYLIFGTSEKQTWNDPDDILDIKHADPKGDIRAKTV